MLNTVTATQFIWQPHKNRKWRKYKKSKVKSVGKKCDGSRKKLTKTPFENWALDRSCKHREDFTFLGKTHSSISYLMLKFEEISFSLYWKVDQNYIIQRICSFENILIVAITAVLIVIQDLFCFPLFCWTSGSGVSCYQRTIPSSYSAASELSTPLLNNLWS